MFGVLAAVEGTHKGEAVVTLTEQRRRRLNAYAKKKAKRNHAALQALYVATSSELVKTLRKGSIMRRTAKMARAINLNPKGW